MPMKVSMRRQIVSLLLLPCVVLTQSAFAFGHTHGENEPAGHGTRAHFHTSACPHHCHDSTHHHHDAVNGNDERDGQQDDRSAPVSEHPHDSDAVYVNKVDVVVRPHTTPYDELVLSCLWVPIGMQLTGAVLDSSARPGICPSDRPPPCAYDCPLYIWQLTLLI